LHKFNGLLRAKYSSMVRAGGLIVEAGGVNTGTEEPFVCGFDSTPTDTGCADAHSVGFASSFTGVGCNRLALPAM
jgi:hypothetical protein